MKFYQFYDNTYHELSLEEAARFFNLQPPSDQIVETDTISGFQSDRFVPNPNYDDELNEYNRHVLHQVPELDDIKQRAKTIFSNIKTDRKNELNEINTKITTATSISELSNSLLEIYKKILLSGGEAGLFRKMSNLAEGIRTLFKEYLFTDLEPKLKEGNIALRFTNDDLHKLLIQKSDSRLEKS